jgi:hypothetical protein
MAAAAVSLSGPDGGRTAFDGWHGSMKPEWVHEIKHDGYRLMVRRDGSRGFHAPTARMRRELIFLSLHPSACVADSKVDGVVIRTRHVTANPSRSCQPTMPARCAG